MPLLPPEDWRAAEAIARIGFVNPFLPERVELERRALGLSYIESGPILRARPGGPEPGFANAGALIGRAEELLAEIDGRLSEGHPATSAEWLVYEDLALFALYGRCLRDLADLAERAGTPEGWGAPVACWKGFFRDFERLLGSIGRDRLPSGDEPMALFAGFFQIERAFALIYDGIIGGSMPAARLRASAWESIFTRDMRRYIRSLHRTMADVPTLIVGPSGSGKEVVARAIGQSGFIPFNASTRCFEVGKAERFVPLNLSALAPTLIESELFGHKKGAFTGALADRDGWLKGRSRSGAVFLDEIGELDVALQVKLLRVLETRKFQRLGDTETFTFEGKIIAATNRDLAAEMHAGRFRPDLYYRLCADQIVTPSLAEQLADRPEDLPELVRFIAREVLGHRDVGPHDEEVERLTDEVVDWIGRGLGRHYPWPGNFRELGQCVRNVMIRGTYRPVPAPPDRPGTVEEFLGQVREVGLTSDEVLARYYALAYERSGENYTAAAARLGVDPRVVKRRIDPAFLERLRTR